MKIMLLILSFLSYLCVYSQNLDKLSEKERNRYLIETSKNIVKKYGPGYYREYKKPVIIRDTIQYRDDMLEEDKKI